MNQLHAIEEGTTMANREQRGNREPKKKPKDKSLKAPTSQESPFARMQGGTEHKKPVGKKSR
jgi:hypothetical protein